MKFNWNSFKRADAAKTIGHRLKINLPLLGIESVIAKVDTGAFSGALHATHAEEFKDKNDNVMLRFRPLGSTEHLIEMQTYHKRRVKSSNGAVTTRFAIDTEVQVFNQTYPITLTLADRSNMKHPMLIGRNFLRIHGFLIDLSDDTE